MSEPPGREVACWIYKGGRQAEAYLYLREKDNFSLVPDALLSAMGKLELVLELTLSPDRKLARADVRTVIADLHDQGFHLQMPPAISIRPLSGVAPPRIH